MTAVELGHAALLIAVGVLAGWVNTVAGAGSVVSLPVLMLIGLPAHDANGTLRLAILVQSLLAVRGFHRAGALRGVRAWPEVPLVVAGALGGAVVATRLPAAALSWVLVGTMLVVAAGMLAPAARTAGGVRALTVPTAAGLVLAGAHGGLAQAGVGLVLVLVLVRGLGHTLVAANALKTVATAAFAALVLPVFVLADQVRWAPALALAAGSGVGAVLGVRFAVRREQGAVRWTIVAIALAGAAVVAARALAQ